MEKTLKNLSGKLADYKRFAIVLLAVGVFFYLGVIIPAVHEVKWHDEAMAITSVVTLATSIFFFAKVKKYKKIINEMTDDDI